MIAPKINRDAEKRFDWPVCYEAERLVMEHLDRFTAHNPFAARLAERMHNETGTLLLDWVDHIVLPEKLHNAFSAVGFQQDSFGNPVRLQKVMWHPESMLPRVILDSEIPTGKSPIKLAIRTDSVSDFLAANAFTATIAGDPLSPYREAVISTQDDTCLVAIERRGTRDCVISEQEPAQTNRILLMHECWKTRKRQFASDAAGWRHTLKLLDEMIHAVGQDLACHIVFAEERAYWERRNRAAQAQKKRQDNLGLGWANHDHHTFRCSRQHFLDLMHALEKLGFERRERYYAGAQAGWGAQILEQPVEGIVAFCDVDLEPDEVEIDFSRQPLPPSKRLGTIGLWIGLHGESFLEAGMHHLECRFDHDALVKQLAENGINTMKPFSDFSFLKQAFTEGERWPVREERARHLLNEGLIDQKQFEQFTREGAIGSHLENLQRRGGFKGFNQKSVSVIIAATDPRKVQPAH